MVAEVPPKDVLGGFYGFFMRALEDFGLPGPDRGQGGKYLVLPPDYKGDIPDGFFVVRSVSNIVWWYGVPTVQGSRVHRPWRYSRA